MKLKKLFIVLIMLLLMCPLFAKTTQLVKRFDIYQNNSIWATGAEYLDVTPAIQEMIDKGWKVVCIVPITTKHYEGSHTAYIIVIFEKEENE